MHEIAKLKSFTQHDYTEEHLKKYNNHYMSGKRKNKIRIVSQLLEDIEGKSVLDIGVGSGFFSRLCIKKKSKTISLDFADTIIQYHRKANPDFTLVQSNAEQLPFKMKHLIWFEDGTILGGFVNYTITISY